MFSARSTRFIRRSLAPLAFTGMLLLAPAAGAMQSDASGDDPKPTQEEREQAQRERARRVVAHRLERIRAEESRLEATLAAIDAGQPLEELDLSDPEARAERNRPRPDQDRDDPGPDDEFTDEQIRAFIAEVYPEWVERMNELEKRDPEAVERMLRERRPRLVELMIERRDHPALFEVRQKIARSEMQIRRAAWSFARADTADERDEAEQALERLLSMQFDLRLDLSRAELAEAEAKVAEIGAQIKEALANRDQLIAERKADLLRAIRDRRSPREGRGRPDRDDRSGPPRSN